VHTPHIGCAKHTSNSLRQNWNTNMPVKGLCVFRLTECGVALGKVCNAQKPPAAIALCTIALCAHSADNKYSTHGKSAYRHGHWRGGRTGALLVNGGLERVVALCWRACWRACRTAPTLVCGRDSLQPMTTCLCDCLVGLSCEYTRDTQRWQI
jgi:hypothetical protein